MKTKIHAIAAFVGFLTIITFWTSTVLVEAFGSHEAITAVKNGILWGMLILAPSMATAGATGASLGRGHTDPYSLRKKKRMPFIVLNGTLVLLPASIFLAIKANAGEFDIIFYTVQALELFGGGVNITLMGFNIHDGLRLSGKLNSSSDTNRPSIELRDNGPVLVSGVTSLIGADGTQLSTKPTMLLCRCGASKTVPFCDGSHNDVNFSDQKSSVRTADELLSYEGREITVHYNKLLCSKAADCGGQLEAVFDVSREPWIDPNQGSVKQIIKVIRSCPCGALSYSLPGRKVQHEIPQDCYIALEKNGPYHVRNIALENAEWGAGACRNKYTLCSCGASKNKPFCDGSHMEASFPNKI